MGAFLGGSVSDIIKSKKTSNSGSKGGALTLIPVVKSGNGAGKGLCEFCGLEYVEPEKPQEPEQPEAPTMTETYTVKVTRSADGKSGTWELVK